MAIHIGHTQGTRRAEPSWSVRVDIRYVALAVALVLVGWWLGGGGRRSSDPLPTLSQATAALNSQSGSFIAVARAATPSVVNISAQSVVPGRRSPLLNDPLFRYFFGDDAPMALREPDRVRRSLGSGVIISSDGLIVTNNHVVAGADRIQVTSANGKLLDAQLVGADPGSDLALLRVNATGLPAIKMADSDRTEVGEWVLAIGNPYGLGQTVTVGIVSAKGRSDVGVSLYEDYIQTDAAINPGNSGGALVNARGELVGINTAIYSESGGSVGIGFAIPSVGVRQVVSVLLRNGRISRGWMGVITTASEAGAVVMNIFRDSPADLIGLQSGDVIEAVNGRRVTTPGSLKSAIVTQPAGTRMTLRVRRGGQVADIAIQLIEHPFDRQGRPVPGA